MLLEIKNQILKNQKKIGQKSKYLAKNEKKRQE